MGRRWLPLALEKLHDHGAAILQPLNDLVIAETRPLEITGVLAIRDESYDAIFLLGELYGREQDPDIEFQVFVSNPLKIRLDELTIGCHVLEPFPHP